MEVSLDWKIGDEFMIINPRLDYLPEEAKRSIHRVIATEFNEPIYGKQNNPGIDKGAVFFKFREHEYSLAYASVSNIRKLTKLERALK